MKNFIFLVGTTNNSELGGPRPSWIDKILLPHLCIVCFITFLAIYQGKFIFGQFWKKLGFGQILPPTPWAKFPTITENLFWRLPLGEEALLTRSDKTAHLHWLGWPNGQYTSGGQIPPVTKLRWHFSSKSLPSPPAPNQKTRFPNGRGSWGNKWRPTTYQFH